jgi:hypothetical protein
VTRSKKNGIVEYWNVGRMGEAEERYWILDTGCQSRASEEVRRER